MVARQLGEQLLELEADMRQMYAKHKKAESEQNEVDLTNLSELPDQKDKDKKAEVIIDLEDELDVKEEEEEVKEEIETNPKQVDAR